MPCRHMYSVFLFLKGSIRRKTEYICRVGICIQFFFKWPCACLPRVCDTAVVIGLRGARAPGRWDAPTKARPDAALNAPTLLAKDLVAESERRKNYKKTCKCTYRSVLPMDGSPLDGAGGVGDASGSCSRRGIDASAPEGAREDGQWSELGRRKKNGNPPSPPRFFRSSVFPLEI